MGAAISLSFNGELDDLSDALAGWAAVLREGAADGPLLLAVNGGHAVVLPGLDVSLGPGDLCPHLEIDASWETMRRARNSPAFDRKETCLRRRHPKLAAVQHPQSEGRAGLTVAPPAQ